MSRSFVFSSIKSFMRAYKVMNNLLQRNCSMSEIFNKFDTLT